MKIQAIDIYTSFLKKKRGKCIPLKDIDFVKRYCKINGNEYIRIKYVLVNVTVDMFLCIC